MTRHNEFEAFVQGDLIAGPVDETAVKLAESELGVTLPPSYRVFLQKFGAVTGKLGTIAGIPPKLAEAQTPQWDDVVQTTKRLRKACRGNLPHSYVFVSDDGGDYKYYLDTEQTAGNGECPVIVLGPGRDGIVVASDFVEFVSRLHSDTLRSADRADTR